MDSFDKKTLKTSRGYTYTYYTADGDKSLPTLFFQHGWPDNAALWKDVAGPLRSTKHPIIIPDLLGYDGTDKPNDPAEYKWDLMTKDLIEIIDKEGGGNVVSIGHDWGSAMASRLYNYYPNRVVGLINLNVPYMPPSRQPFDLDAVNAFTEATFGYPIYSYWHLFTAPDGPAVLKEHVDRLYEVMHGQADTMKQFFTGPNAMREYLTSGNSSVKLRSYALDDAFRKEFVHRFTRDGFEGPQCWYKAYRNNIQLESDSKLPEERDKVNVPALYIGATDDAVCRPESMIPTVQAGLLPHLENAGMVDASHWVTYEKPQEVVEKIEPWLKKTFQ